MNLWWIAIALICFGIIGALFRRQILLISLNLDIALLGICLGCIHSSQVWGNPIGFQIAMLILGTIMLHQVLTFSLTYYLFKKHGTLHIDELRNLRG